MYSPPSSASIAERLTLITNSYIVFWSTIINGVQTVVFGITLVAVIGSIKDVLAAGSPIQSIFLNITGSRSATNVMIIGLLIIGICCGLAQVANLSRLTWAWARDGGLPVYFAHVSPPNLSQQTGQTRPLTPPQFRSIPNSASLSAPSCSPSPSPAL